MKIHGDYKISFAEKEFTKDALEHYLNQASKETFDIRINNDEISDLAILLNLLTWHAPVNIWVFDGTILTTRLSRFPYIVHTIDKDGKIQTSKELVNFTIRMTPSKKSWKIQGFEIDKNSNIPVSSVFMIDNMLRATFDNGLLIFELLQEYDKKLYAWPMQPERFYVRELTVRAEDITS